MHAGIAGNWLFVIYSSCNFLPVIGSVDVRLSAAGTAGGWKHAETSGRIGSVPNSLLGFLLALQQGLGLLVDLPLAWFVFSKRFKSKYSEYKELFAQQYTRVGKFHPWLLNFFFQSCGDMLWLISKCTIHPLPQLCLWMHMPIVLSNCLICAQATPNFSPADAHMHFHQPVLVISPKTTYVKG